MARGCINKDKQVKWTNYNKEAILDSTYFKCNGSRLDNEIINRHFDLFWKDKEETARKPNSSCNENQHK